MPNVVKGSKQEKMVVVPYRPGRRFVFVCLLALGIGASAIGGFMFGYSNTLRSQQSKQATQQELSEQLIGAETENSELRRRVAILDRSSVMDQRATEEVQVTIIGLRDRVAQLEQDIVYYRQVVSAQTEDTGLIISQLDIRLRFKYFQNIEGELVLPENFVPDRLQVAAVSVEPVEKSINQNFSWVVER